MSKLTIDCPICLNFHHRKTKFNLCFHAVCNECAYKMMNKSIKKCPICREDIKLGLIPDTIIVVDECFKKLQPNLFFLGKKLKPTYQGFYYSNSYNDEIKEPKYYDNNDSDYDSDNDEMN